MYKLIRNFLFLFPAEPVHHFSMSCMDLACRIPLFRRILRSAFSAKGKGMQRRVAGLDFSNPVGLAAGFDKNARYLAVLECLGFGFVEIGTVTPLPQAGNDKPRLFRLRKDRALINRMGFNNEGAARVAANLKAWRAWKKKHKDSREVPFLVGGNIGKNKATANEDAWKDYVQCFRALNEVVDYFVINVSSPNTPGLRALQEKAALSGILERVQSVNRELNPKPKPLFLKIAPDLSIEQLDEILALVTALQLDGIVATNTTISREGLLTGDARVQAIGAGGLSGGPLRQRSTGVVRHIRAKSKGKLAIIGSGGIFTAGDAEEKLDAGADLLQVWTGFIYEGPAIVRRLLAGRRAARS